MTTSPDSFHKIHLLVCPSTSDYLKQNIARLETDFPLMVSAAVQTAGRGRENRAWVSPEDLGIYATFGFHLPDSRGLSLLSIVSGIAVIDMLESWTGKDICLEMAQRYPGGRKKNRRHSLRDYCESRQNHLPGRDRGECQSGQPMIFPEALRSRAGSLKLLTGTEWPLPDGRDALAASMACWLEKLFEDDAGLHHRPRPRAEPFFSRARQFLFITRGKLTQGIFLDIAPDGGLLLGLPGSEIKAFYSGELD